MSIRIRQEDGDLRIETDTGNVRVRKEYGEYKIYGDDEIVRNLGGPQQLIRTYENWDFGDERKESRVQFQRLERNLSQINDSIKEGKSSKELEEITRAIRNLRHPKKSSKVSTSYSDYSSGGGLYPGTMSGGETHTEGGGIGVLAGLGVGAPVIGGIIAIGVKESGGKGLPWFIGSLIFSGLAIGVTGLWLYLDNKKHDKIIYEKVREYYARKHQD